MTKLGARHVYLNALVLGIYSKTKTKDEQSLKMKIKIILKLKIKDIIFNSTRVKADFSVLKRKIKFIKKQRRQKKNGLPETFKFLICKILSFINVGRFKNKL